MNRAIVKKIRESGLKINFLASKINVTPNYLSMCIRGDRNLSELKENVLIDYLNSLPE